MAHFQAPPTSELEVRPRLRARRWFPEYTLVDSQEFLMRNIRLRNEGFAEEPSRCNNRADTVKVAAWAYSSNFTGEGDFDPTDASDAWYMRVSVGTLHSTQRNVYATFLARKDQAFDNVFILGKMLKLNGSNTTPKIVLIAEPVTSHGRVPDRVVVQAAQLTNKHGLRGFHACAEVCDWGLVDFKPEYQGNGLRGTWKKIVVAMWNRKDRLEEEGMDDAASVESEEEEEEKEAQSGSRSNPIDVDGPVDLTGDSD